MNPHGRVLDAKDTAQRLFQITDVGFGHAIGIVDEKDKGGRLAFSLGQIEKLGPHPGAQPGPDVEPEPPP